MNKRKPCLAIDMDGVICQFVPAVCERYYLATGKNLKPEDITEWNMRKFGVSDDMWIKPGFFYGLKPIPGALESLYKLKEDYIIAIATDTMNIDYVKTEKDAWLDYYLPHIKKRYYIRDKSLVPAHLLFDDGPHHLEGFPGITVKMEHPYNHDIKANFTVKNLNWKEFERILHGLYGSPKGGF